jgi:hypothetical protein
MESGNEVAQRVAWQVRRSVDRYLQGETSLAFLTLSLDQAIQYAEANVVTCAEALRATWYEVEEINSLVLADFDRTWKGAVTGDLIHHLLGRMVALVSPEDLQ